MTKAEQILRKIKKSKGLRFTEIQRFIVELNGRVWDQFETDYQGHRKRVNRGYYTVCLGLLLEKWCMHCDCTTSSPT